MDVFYEYSEGDINSPELALYVNMWLNHKVKRVIEVKSDQLTAVQFDNGRYIYYTTHQDIFKFVDALRTYKGYETNDVIKDYLTKYGYYKAGCIECTETLRRISQEGLTGGPITGDIEITSDGSIKIPDTTEMMEAVKRDIINNIISTPEPEKEYAAIIVECLKDDDKAAKFIDAPFKVIRDYLHACAFISAFAPNFVDYANDLLAYQIGYAMSYEKEVDGHTAVKHLVRELNDFASHYTGDSHHLKASFKQELLTGYALPVLIIRSDFGTIKVPYEPTLTPLEWEKRYTEMRRRHG